jgi:hypothetical protein
MAAYRELSDEDARAVFAYLRTVPPLLAYVRELGRRATQK